LVDRETTMLYGPTQSYKSFIALDLALSVAAGVRAFTGDVPLRSGPVFYAALEGRVGIMRQRRPAWKAARGVTEPIPFYVGPAPALSTEGEKEEWEADTKRILAGRRCGAIFLDTVAKVMLGMNENDAKDMGLVIRWCDYLAEEFQCPIVAVHHTGRDATHSRGSSAADAGFGSVIVATADRAAKMVKVHVQKHKDAEEPAEPWYLAGRMFGGSLVFDPTTKEEYAAATRVDSVFSPGKLQRVLVTIDPKREGVSPHTLAVTLASSSDGETGEDLEKRVASITRTLAKAARSDKYSSYITEKGFWVVPE
jgi:hypothetical protein